MKILFVFSGQGYQDSSLFSLFQENHQAMKRLSDFSSLTNVDFLQPNVPISNPNFTQLIIGVYQLTLFSMLKPLCHLHQIELAGYSLGEISALLTSIDASLEESIKLYTYRSQLMATLLNQNYDLLSICGNFDLAEVVTVCARNRCYIAIVNSEQHLVLGGKIADLDQLISEVQQQVAHVKFLKVHLPSHTPYYSDKKGLLLEFMNKNLPQSGLSYPIISPLELTKIYDFQQEKCLLDQELYTPLQWHSVCELIGAYQYDLIIDLGPGAAMSTILTGAHPQLAEVRRVTTSQYKSLDGLLTAIMRSL
ncbi:acyltransferase domain-containing protein [Legionella rowbothamii]|uniref:acyltransferase domain-containing protein n=1 Tax=Legionella rowbothamii TaxID=96229 RepID=UPI001054F6D9|nr:acyltransferase domain-containing protein [Legionella rowbothamii]